MKVLIVKTGQVISKEAINNIHDQLCKQARKGPFILLPPDAEYEIVDIDDVDKTLIINDPIYADDVSLINDFIRRT